MQRIYTNQIREDQFNPCHQCSILTSIKKPRTHKHPGFYKLYCR